MHPVGINDSPMLIVVTGGGLKRKHFCIVIAVFLQLMLTLIFNSRLDGIAYKVEFGRTQTGANVVEFADGGRISFSTPEFWLRGILWGDRIAEYLGTMEFRDKQNGLSCILRFNPDATGYIRYVLLRL